ncbi:hypothetical protein JOD57_002324 [Geodermatophilus bullaregiensis]|nr:hypothetical protein [Geodermatophilus bullaregiensis]
MPRAHRCRRRPVEVPGEVDGRRAPRHRHDDLPGRRGRPELGGLHRGRLHRQRQDDPAVPARGRPRGAARAPGCGGRAAGHLPRRARRARGRPGGERGAQHPARPGAGAPPGDRGGAPRRVAGARDHDRGSPPPRPGPRAPRGRGSLPGQRRPGRRGRRLRRGRLAGTPSGDRAGRRAAARGGHAAVRHGLCAPVPRGSRSRGGAAPGARAGPRRGLRVAGGGRPGRHGALRRHRGPVPAARRSRPPGGRRGDVAGHGQPAGVNPFRERRTPFRV